MKTNKKTLKLHESAPPEIQKIFEYVVSKNFSFMSLIKLRIFAETEYLPTLPELNSENYKAYVEKIKDFCFDFKNYNDATEEERELMWALSCFRDEFLIVIEKTFDKDWEKKHEEYRLVRQVSPPLSAYKMVAFCKSDIKSTGRDYGLLFE